MYAGDNDCISSYCYLGLWAGVFGLILVVLFPLRDTSPGLGEYVVHQFGGALFFAATIFGVKQVPGVLREVEVPWLLTVLAKLFSRSAIVVLVMFFVSVLVDVPILNSIQGVLQRACFMAICLVLIVLSFGIKSAANLSGAND